jgi:hypothetical protein
MVFNKLTNFSRNPSPKNTKATNIVESIQKKCDSPGPECHPFSSATYTTSENSPSFCKFDLPSLKASDTQYIDGLLVDSGMNLHTPLDPGVPACVVCDWWQLRVQSLQSIHQAHVYFYFKNFYAFMPLRPPRIFFISIRGSKSSVALGCPTMPFGT